MANRKLFVNVAVEDLGRSVEFFTGLGFEFDERFADETATCMVIGEDAYAMLIVRDRFREFAVKELCDPRTHTEALLAFAVGSREEVDSVVGRALATGGGPAGEPQDHRFMYERAFEDPDGHHWSAFWMDPAALEHGPAEAAAAG